VAVHERSGRAALEATCATADAHLHLLAGMFLAHGEVFHRPGPDALVVDVFAEPFERLLRDGAADGTLLPVPVTVTATVLFNTVGWGYIHLRAAHHWDPERARAAVIDLILRGLLTDPDSSGLAGSGDRQIIMPPNAGRDHHDDHQ
jgi:hypothetical protein